MSLYFRISFFRQNLHVTELWWWLRFIVINGRTYRLHIERERERERVSLYILFYA